MKPSEIYTEIEAAWKDAVVHSMVLTEIVSGRQKANPEAFTFAEQLKNWSAMGTRMRSILDRKSVV